MKIGILTSGNDMLALFSFLQRYDHEYHIWYDDLFLFWGDRSVDVVMDRIAKGVAFLQEKNVDVILVPPLVELKIRNENLFPGVNFLPLFENYVLKYCFAYSLVGKIGFFGDYFDILEGQKQLEILAKNYVLSDNQRQIRKFCFPFSYRGKEVRSWKYMLDSSSCSAPLLHHRLKKDLTYFKDAAVDTLIPCNYTYFLAQKALKKTVFSQMRFYDLSVLESVFVACVSDFSISDYSVAVYFTDHAQFLLSHKTLFWQLSRGKKIEVLSFPV